MTRPDTRHECPAPECDQLVARSKYACRTDWYRLPAALRSAIWDGYRIGPLSRPHLDAMHDADRWYRDNPRRPHA